MANRNMSKTAFPVSVSNSESWEQCQQTWNICCVFTYRSIWKESGDSAKTEVALSVTMYPWTPAALKLPVSQLDWYMWRWKPSCAATPVIPQLLEPPGAAPHVGWCGGRNLLVPPIPIMLQAGCPPATGRAPTWSPMLVQRRSGRRIA